MGCTTFGTAYAVFFFIFPNNHLRSPTATNYLFETHPLSPNRRRNRNAPLLIVVLLIQQIRVLRRRSNTQEALVYPGLVAPESNESKDIGYQSNEDRRAVRA